MLIIHIQHVNSDLEYNNLSEKNNPHKECLVLINNQLYLLPILMLLRLSLAKKRAIYISKVIIKLGKSLRELLICIVMMYARLMFLLRTEFSLGLLKIVSLLSPFRKYKVILDGIVKRVFIIICSSLRRAKNQIKNSLKAIRQSRILDSYKKQINLFQNRKKVPFPNSTEQRLLLCQLQQKFVRRHSKRFHRNRSMRKTSSWMPNLKKLKKQNRNR